MTLAIAARATNGLVMAADSRMSVVHEGVTTATMDFSDKFLQINRDVGAMTYGLAIPGFAGISRLIQDGRASRPDFATYAQVVQRAPDIFRSEWEKFREDHEDVDGLVGFVIGGYDMVETNQFRVHSFVSSDDFVGQENQQPLFLAAQWHLSQYLGDMLYHEHMTVEAVAELVVFMVQATSTISEGVGGPIQLATVTTEAGFQSIHPSEVNNILERNARRYSRIQAIAMDEILGSLTGLK